MMKRREKCLLFHFQKRWLNKYVLANMLIVNIFIVSKISDNLFFCHKESRKHITV